MRFSGTRSSCAGIPDSTPSQKQRIDVIHSSANHLLNLINDILEMSKIEAGRATLTLEPFDLHTLLGMFA
jgi:two-component system sensor histidine kinase/response regulator